MCACLMKEVIRYVTSSHCIRVHTVLLSMEEKERKKARRLLALSEDSTVLDQDPNSCSQCIIAISFSVFLANLPCRLWMPGKFTSLARSIFPNYKHNKHSWHLVAIVVPPRGWNWSRSSLRSAHFLFGWGGQRVWTLPQCCSEKCRSGKPVLAWGGNSIDTLLAFREGNLEAKQLLIICHGRRLSHWLRGTRF